MKAITYFKNYFGIGYNKSRYLCDKLGIKINLKKNYFDYTKLIKLEDSTDLKIKKHININFIKNLKTYKGVRLEQNLPVNGQRTKTNAKTRKKFKII